MPSFRNRVQHEDETTPARVKLLVDANISHKLPALLQDLFPESLHVRHVLRTSASDTEVWRYAHDHQLTVLTKNADDFQQLARQLGHPPKILIVTLGNRGTTSVIADLLRHHADRIQDFIARSPDAALNLP